MVTLITGAINSGKTTELYALYQRIGNGDGILLPKVVENGVPVGQDILHLSSEERHMFSRRVQYLPAGWDEAFCYRDYSFSATGLRFGKDTLRDACQRRVPNVFVDEIGPLELSGSGFCDEFASLLSLPVQVYAAVRLSSLFQVVKYFSINEFKLIEKY